MSDRCTKCKRWWPNDLVHILFTTEGNIKLDPICALEEIRKAHGVPDYEFTGELTIERYQRALQILAQRKDPQP